MISESITYLQNSDEVVKTVLIGGLLSISSVLLVPAFVVSGYLVRVLQRTMNGNDEAPVFEDWERLLVDGLKAFAIAAVYGLVPAIVGFVLVGGGIMAAFSGDAGSLIGGTSIFVGLLLSMVLGLAAWYVIPAATANFAETGRLSDGFDIGTLRPVLLSRTYATGWLLALGVIVLGGLVAGVLNVVPLLGTIVGVFVSFYAAVAAYYIIGHTWADLRTVETHHEGTVDERPAA
ncbi:DUF4013 domain-containing protein [Halococcus hamelinensis]|nr:DUF4013 domain-containing protein [Halococcus hamelinensis]